MGRPASRKQAKKTLGISIALVRSKNRKARNVNNNTIARRNGKKGYKIYETKESLLE